MESEVIADEDRQSLASDDLLELSHTLEIVRERLFDQQMASGARGLERHGDMQARRVRHDYRVGFLFERRREVAYGPHLQVWWKGQAPTPVCHDVGLAKRAQVPKMPLTDGAKTRNQELHPTLIPKRRTAISAISNSSTESRSTGKASFMIRGRILLPVIEFFSRIVRVQATSTYPFCQ